MFETKEMAESKMGICRKRLLHVYPATMIHHLSRMIENNNQMLSSYENAVVLMSGIARPSGLSAGSNKVAQNGVTISPLGMIFFLLRSRFDFVIFHSGFWPKYWFVALFAVIIRRRPILVFWGGELSPAIGFRGRVNAAIKKFVIPRLHRAVFLSAGDVRRAEQKYRSSNRSSVIHYYNPTILSATNRLEIPGQKLSGVRMQIGNDASAVNGHLDCIERLAGVPNLNCTLVYPFGYGRFDLKYIQHVKSTSELMFPNKSKFIDELLSPEQFDSLMDSCNGLLLASREQRALYSILRHLAAGKPVFLPKTAGLRLDLMGEGFQIEALEDIDAMAATKFILLCERVNAENVRVAHERLGIDAIRMEWANILGKPCANLRGE